MVGLSSIIKSIPSVLRASLKCDIDVRYVSVGVIIKRGSEKSISEFFLEKSKVIGKILAETDCELWVNSDRGMLVAIGRAYKDFGGKKLVVLYPDKGEPWPKEHAKPYVKNTDELKKEPNWFWSNYNVTALPDLCICVGLSAGTLSELAYIKWNYQLKCGNLKKLIG